MHPERGTSPQTRQQAGRDGKLILVVEDDAAFRQDICDFLESEGYRTIGAFNGREAFGLLHMSTERPALIVLDLMMEGVNGIEFREWQRRNATFAGIPLVVVSGSPDAEKLTKDLGCDRVLPKPLNVEHLLEALDAILN